MSATNEQNKKEELTGWQKFLRHVKTGLVHLLILAAAASFIYGKTVSYRHEMEKQIWSEKQRDLEQEIEKLKAPAPAPQAEAAKTSVQTATVRLGK
jgi:hypothetical protein